MQNQIKINQTSFSKRRKTDHKLLIFQKAQEIAKTNLTPNQVGEANIKKYMRDESVERDKLILILLVHTYIFHKTIQNEDLNCLFDYIIDRAWPKLNDLIQDLDIITDENSKLNIIWLELIQILMEDLTNLTDKEKEFFFDRLLINQGLDKHVSDWQHSDSATEIQYQRVTMLADTIHLCICINTETINYLSQDFIKDSNNIHSNLAVNYDQKMQVLSKRLILIESYQDMDRRGRHYQDKKQQTIHRSKKIQTTNDQVHRNDDIFKFSPPQVLESYRIKKY